VIVGGLRLCGRVDETRAGYVVTRFFHIWFVPLVPLSSWFVSAAGTVPIPLSLRSLIAAYARGFAVVLSLGCTAGLIYMAFELFGDLQIYLRGGTAVTEAEIVESVVLVAALAVGALGGVVIYFATRWFRKASAARCAELARITRMPVTPL
jgi:hypothetical protein